MDEIVAPTCEQLSDDELPSVFRESDDSWRHGVRVTQVFHRESDKTYWRAHYRLSTDGETNELAEGRADITRVYPHQVTTTVYKSTPD